MVNFMLYELCFSFLKKDDFHFLIKYLKYPPGPNELFQSTFHPNFVTDVYVHIYVLILYYYIYTLLNVYTHIFIQ